MIYFFCNAEALERIISAQFSTASNPQRFIPRGTKAAENSAGLNTNPPSLYVACPSLSFAFTSSCSVLMTFTASIMTLLCLSTSGARLTNALISFLRAALTMAGDGGGGIGCCCGGGARRTLAICVVVVGGLVWLLIFII